MTVFFSVFSTLPMMAAWLGLWMVARELAARGMIPADRRHSFILASIGWGILLVTLSEFAGWVRSLDRGFLVLLWWIAAFAGGAVALRLRSRRADGLKQAALAFLRDSVDARGLVEDARREWLLTLILVVFITFLGAVALLTPTTNWDSMSYHLPRVFHWIQQQSLAHYPTSIERQLEMGPWSAFVQLHFLLLSGADHLANMVQWGAMLGSVLVATLITRQLLPSSTPNLPRLQLLAAVLVVTLPIGIVESVNPQTDYVTAFWFLCAASLSLELCRQPRQPWIWAAAAAACGLGLLSKATALLYLAPFVVLLLYVNFRAYRPVSAVTRLLAFAAMIGLLNLPHGLRNVQSFGSPTGSAGLRMATTNARVSGAVFMSNMIRNAALHTGTGIRPLTRGLNHMVAWLHPLTGRALTDPETTFPKTAPGLSFSEELLITDSSAGCPYHIALILVATGVSLIRFRSCRLILLYAGMIFAGIALICASLRWQQWNSRLHLPSLVALMPFVVAALAPWLRRLPVTLIAIGMAAFGWIVIANNASRPVFNRSFRDLPRMQQMLALHPGGLYQHIREVSRRVAATRCRTVGLKFGIDEPELAFWLLLLGQGFTGRIDHVFVENPSGRLSIPLEPEVIIAASYSLLPDHAAARYTASNSIGPYTLYWKADHQ